MVGVVAAIAARVEAGLDARLVEQLGHMTPDEEVRVLVHVTGAVDVQGVTDGLGGATRATRHRTIVAALRARAELTQPPVRELLETLRHDGRVLAVRPFWIGNIIAVTARAGALDDIAGHPMVRHVYVDPRVERIAPVETMPAGGVAAGGPEPGLAVIGVPEVWAMGFRGEGLLVAALDTGVDGLHEAFGSRWAGLDPPYSGHPEWAWFDPLTETPFPQTFDGDPHGTLVTGTLCGGAPGDAIGVLPEARWIHAAVIGRGPAPSVADNIEAIQWLVDPDGNPETTWDVPHVCCHAWGVVDGFGVPDCDPLFWTFIDAAEAAGVMMFFAAGNEGADGLRNPADRATTAYDSFAVGAIDQHDPAFPVADFSARGPESCTPSGVSAIKPELVGPGVLTRTALAGGGYAVQSGTSSAVPHVAGVAALVRQACPELSSSAVKQILFDTAIDLGAPGEDNDAGHGMLDAAAAVNLALELCQAPDAGALAWTRASYTCDAVATVELHDAHLDVNPLALDEILIVVSSGSEPAGQPLTLVETAPDSARFAGVVQLGSTDTHDVLHVTDGDDLLARYLDEDDGAGAAGVVTAGSSVDCVPPAINEIAIDVIDPIHAVVTIDANEPVRGRVRLGPGCGPFDTEVPGFGFADPAFVDVNWLEPDTTYTFRVEVEDQAGNLTVDDNGGLCHTMTTAPAPGYFLELFGDAPLDPFDLEHRTIRIEPDGSPGYYTACIEPIDHLPSDPSAGAALDLGDNDAMFVELAGDATVPFFGIDYAGVYVSSNGGVSFLTANPQFDPSLQIFFQAPRVGLFWGDLDPSTGGAIRAAQFADRLAITFDQINPAAGDDPSTGQIEFHFDGTVTLSYLDTIDDPSFYAVAGLSAGNGRGADGAPPFYTEPDLSSLGTCCDGDVNASGVVDVDDLVSVILDWGPCPGCAADLNGNGAVDVDDLIAVILGWGACD